MNTYHVPYYPSAWKQHNNSSYALGTVAGYAYNGSGERELAVQYAPGSNNQQQMQSWREYTYFNGQPYAEKDNTGAWTDYIYAGGKKIAKVGGSDTRLHREATVCGGCGWQWTALYTGTALHGVTVQPGDRLVVSQYATPGTTAGVGLNFTDGSYGPSLGMVDAQGYQSDSDGVTGSWHHRVLDLSSLAGRVIDFAYFMTPGTNGAGHWSVDYRDFAYVAADGTVTRLYSGEDPSGWFQPATTGQSGLTTVSQTGAPYPGAVAPLYYYLADQVGTTQLELSAGGWPVWQGQFAPFGQELDNQATSMRFKFTGKERDTESGLDYFGARMYASSMGRFMSPDDFGGHMEDPQTLNRYSYVGNNPLSRTDPDGHDFYLGCTQTKDNASTCQSQQVSTDAKGNAVNATVQGTSKDGNFTATRIGNDANGGLVDKTTGTGSYTGTFDGQNVSLKNSGGGTANGVWLQNSDAVAGIAGSGALNQFNFTFHNHNEVQQLAADYTFNGTQDQAAQALERAGFVHWNTGFHFGRKEYRSPSDVRSSTHFALGNTTLDPRYNVPTNHGDMHTGEYYPGEHILDHFWHDVTKH